MPAEADAVAVAGDGTGKALELAARRGTRNALGGAETLAAEEGTDKAGETDDEDRGTGAEDDTGTED